MDSDRIPNCGLWTQRYWFWALSAVMLVLTAYNLWEGRFAQALPCFGLSILGLLWPGSHQAIFEYGYWLGVSDQLEDGNGV